VSLSSPKARGSLHCLSQGLDSLLQQVYLTLTEFASGDASGEVAITSHDGSRRQHASVSAHSPVKRKAACRLAVQLKEIRRLAVDVVLSNKRFVVRLCKRYTVLHKGMLQQTAKQQRPQANVYLSSLIDRICPSSSASSLAGAIKNSNQATYAGGGWCRRHVCC